jgi:hypothetical protein
MDESIQRAPRVRVKGPGITSAFGTWATVLDRFWRLSPWRWVPESVAFSFESDVPELRAAVATLMSDRDEPGLAIHETRDSFDRIRAIGTENDFGGIERIAMLCLSIERGATLSDEDQEYVRARGLALPGGRVPRLLRVVGVETEALDAHMERLVLAGVEGVLGICETVGGAVLVAPAVATVRTVLGPIEVHSTPPGH